MKIPELRSSDFTEYLQDPTDDDREYAVDTYSHLGAFCFHAFTDQEPRLQTGGVRHGFNTVARLIRIAAALYPEHQAQHDQSADHESLKAILLQSVDTPLRFAGMPNATNSLVEQYFGLKTDALPYNVRELYAFEPNADQDTLFVANDDHFFKATSDAEVETPFDDFRLNKQCPMQDFTRNVVWPGMITLAAETPQAIAQDLGQPATSTVSA